MREGFTGGGTVVAAGTTIGVEVCVGDGVMVIVEVAETGGACVKVGNGVLISPDG